jgi:hypothetical protein
MSPGSEKTSDDAEKARARVDELGAALDEFLAAEGPMGVDPGSHATA